MILAQRPLLFRLLCYAACLDLLDECRVHGLVLLCLWDGVSRLKLPCGLKKQSPAKTARGSRSAIGCGCSLRYTAKPKGEWLKADHVELGRKLLEDLIPLVSMLRSLGTKTQACCGLRRN